MVEDFDRDSSTQDFIDPKRIPALQKIADNACRCSRGNGDDARCWSDFWKEVNGYRHISGASACGPGSSAYVEFESGKDATDALAMTVLTEYGYGACSADEVELKKSDYEQKASQPNC